MVSATDGSAFTGTVTVYVTVDAGTQAIGSVGSGICTHEGQSYHTYAPAQAETNGDLIAFTFTGTGAVPETVQIYARAATPDVNVASVSNDAITASAIQDAALTAAKFASGAFDAVWIVTTRELSAFDASFKTGYALSSAGVQAIWDTLTSALTTVGSVGKRIADFLTGDVYARLGAPAGASIAADLAEIEAQTDDIGIAGAGLTALGDTRLANLDATVSSRLATAGYTTPPTVGAIANQVWDEATADHQTAGTTGKALTDAGAAGTPPTVGEIADAVWDEAAADHTTSGSTGAALGAAGSAGDPWETSLPGAYGAGTAGQIIGGNLNASVSSRATQTSVDDVPTNAELATALAGADDAILAAVAALNDLSAADIRTAVGLASANLDTQLGNLPTNAELATALASADDAVLAAISALNNLSQANIRTAVGLGSANLDTQLGDVPTNAELATALSTAYDAVLAAIAALNNLSAAQVNAEVVDAIATDVYSEPNAVPAATTSLVAKINWLAVLARNTVTQTSTTQTLKDDAGTSDIATAAVSDDGTVFQREKWS